jgi:hypothetical protein
MIAGSIYDAYVLTKSGFQAFGKRGYGFEMCFLRGGFGFVMGLGVYTPSVLMLWQRGGYSRDKSLRLAKKNGNAKTKQRHYTELNEYKLGIPSMYQHVKSCLALDVGGVFVSQGSSVT